VVAGRIDVQLGRDAGTRIDLTPIDRDAQFILRTPPGPPGYLGAAHAGFEVNSVNRCKIMLNGRETAEAIRFMVQVLFLAAPHEPPVPPMRCRRRYKAS
jgi:hypothetical protein